MFLLSLDDDERGAGEPGGGPGAAAVDVAARLGVVDVGVGEEADDE
jgi:hypothetical protein